MTESLISFETSKLAKDKGCNLFSGNMAGFIMDKPQCVILPTQSLLHRWLRETHGIYIELIIDAWVNDDCIEEPAYRAFIWQVGQPRPKPWDDLGCSNYEKILEVALQHALELINP